MRINSGQWRGRVIRTHPGEKVRPTADKVRQAWMNIISTSIPGARVLDLCAGSGALGIEALSRGASAATFVEQNADIIAILKSNLEKLDAKKNATVIKNNAVRFVANLESNSFDVAFADPPYRSNIAVEIAQQWLKVPFSKILGVEHSSDISLPEGGETRKYGSSSITFYR